MDTFKTMQEGRSLKGGKVRASHMESLTLKPPPDIADEDITEAFKDLVMPQNPLQQMGAVEKLLMAAMKCDENAKVSTRILVMALLQLPSKSQLRTKISKFVSTIATKYSAIYEECVLDLICEALSNEENPLLILQAVTLVVEDWNNLFPNQKKRPENDVITTEIECEEREMTSSVLSKFHIPMLHGIQEGITQLWSKHYKEAPSSVEAAQVLQHLQQLVKNSTAYLQHNCDEEDVEVCNDLQLLLDIMICIIQDPSCPLDLRINCGQLIAVLQKLHSSNGLYCLVQDVVARSCKYADLLPLAQLAVINGILCISHVKELYSSNPGCDSLLGIRILQVVLSPNYQLNEGSMALSAIRMVQHWTLRTLEAVKHADNLDNLKCPLHPSSSLISSLLDYLWLSWDHFLDSVKHAAKDCFQNIVKIHVELCPDDSKTFYAGLCRSLLNQPLSRKYRLSAISCMVPVVSSQTLLEYDPLLPRMLLTLLRDPSLASHAADLLEALFTAHAREVPQKEWQDVWLPAFISSFRRDMQTFGYELLFKKLLFTCTESLDVALSMLLNSVDGSASEKLCLLIMCVKIGRHSVYWQNKCKEKNYKNANDYWKCIIPYKTIFLCLGHMEEAVHNAAFSLLCESPKSTELPEKKELDLILEYFSYSITNQNSSFKQHLLKSTKKLFLRIKEGLRILLKSKKNLEHQIVTDLASFCTRLFLLMLQNLHYGANLARRGTSLLVLELFFEILSPDCTEVFGNNGVIYSQMFVDTLLCVLDDSYESNKSVALKLLLQLPHLGTEYESKMMCLVNATNTLASSCRPPDSLTASYVLKYLLNDPVATKIVMKDFSHENQSQNSQQVFFEYLLESLKKEVEVAQSSLLKAAASGPMYGLLLCIRTLLLDISMDNIREHHYFWKTGIKKIMSICYVVSDLVAPVVRNSSPEGHLPMDLNPESLASLKAILQVSLGNHQYENNDISLDLKPEDLMKAHAVSAQMLLLCAWRCIKEISLILGDIILNYPLQPDSLALLSAEDVLTIGQYFLTQLSETKHRGAFEQSYVGFSRICEQLWRCVDEQLSKLPEEWLTNILNDVQNDEDDRLCATRRSAGVPFIIQAVLASEPKVRGALCLKNTMNCLLHLAGEQQYSGSNARIHAFNILRAIYRESRLGDLIVPYAPSGVKAAIRGYNSDSWAERNAAALLFASLITRMFGVKRTQDDLSRRNSMSALVFFRRFPELYDFLKSELEIGTAGVKEGKLVPALFPTLLLLARLAPSPIEGRSSNLSLSSFTPVVLQCTSSSVLQLRGLASHALIPLVTPDTVAEIVSQLCKKASLTNQNELHGCLQCLVKLLKCYIDSVINDNKLSFVVSDLMSISWAATEANPCLLTRCCAIELFILFLTKNLLSDEHHELSLIYSGAYNLVINSNTAPSHMPWSALCQKAASQYLLCSTQESASGRTELMCLLIDSDNYDVRLTCLFYVVNLDTVPLSIFEKLMNLIHYKEYHSDCLIYCYRIVNMCITHNENGKYCSNLESLIVLLKHTIKQASEKSCIELVSEVLCLSSSIMTALMSQVPFISVEEFFNQWLDMMTGFIGSESDSEIRTQAARAISHILPFLSTHPSISGQARLKVCEALITQLQDDSDVVRDIAAAGAGMHLDHEGTHSARQPSRVLEVILGVIANMGTCEAMSLLVKLALKEDIPEGFGLTQDEDRVFDKGEMNTYREDVTIARIAANSILVAFHVLPEEVDPPLFLKDEILPNMLASPKLQNDIDECTDYLSGPALMNLLEEDIKYIYDHLSPLEGNAVYCVKNIDLWLVRLWCRSALWKILSGYFKTCSDLVNSVSSNLQKSIIKGQFITEIITNLS